MLAVECGQGKSGEYVVWSGALKDNLQGWN
jgi:hypothetical protein